MYLELTLVLVYTGYNKCLEVIAMFEFINVHDCYNKLYDFLEGDSCKADQIRKYIQNSRIDPSKRRIMAAALDMWYENEAYICAHF